jgi:endonuclease/exonuclease/phosphatase family metal-dependent hydrolase
MKPDLRLIPALVLLFIPALVQVRSQTITVATWNIRYNNPGDGVNAWPNRKEKVFDQIRRADPDILCLQEVLKNQIDDLKGALRGFSWIGAGRDDGKEAGEYVPVFYRKKKLELLTSGHFWLSESPEIPGKLGWDAACPRMVTWLSLKNKQSGDTLFVFNTHLDHVGVKARENGSRLLAENAAAMAGTHPVIVTGDFNTTPEDPAYETMFFHAFRDSRNATSNPPSGPEYTFTGFDASRPPGGRIDYIFIRNNLKVLNYNTVATVLKGFYNSDHLMVVAVLKLTDD